MLLRCSLLRHSFAGCSIVNFEYSFFVYLFVPTTTSQTCPPLVHSHADHNANTMIWNCIFLFLETRYPMRHFWPKNWIFFPEIRVKLEICAFLVFIKISRICLLDMLMGITSVQRFFQKCAFYAHQTLLRYKNSANSIKFFYFSLFVSLSIPPSYAITKWVQPYRETAKWSEIIKPYCLWELILLAWSFSIYLGVKKVKYWKNN